MKRVLVGMAVVVSLMAFCETGYATFNNALDNAVGHWMFDTGSETPLNDNNPPNTNLSLAWSGENPWGTTSNGFTNDTDGYVHLSGNGSNRLYVTDVNAGELVFTGSVTTWTRIKWNGQVDNINRLMGRQGTSELGWVLNIQGTTAKKATFYVSSDGATTYEDVNANYTFLPDTWYDICGTFDHTTGQLSVYVYDPYTGQQLASDTRTTPLRSLYTPVSEFNLLRSQKDNIYVDIESAAVWGRALTSTEIQNLTNVPEPVTMVLLGLGGLLLRRRN